MGVAREHRIRNLATTLIPVAPGTSASSDLGRKWLILRSDGRTTRLD